MSGARPFRAFGRALALLTVFVLGVPGLHGQVAVEILSMPSEMYSFEPLYVLYAIENIGGSPIYLPAEAAPNQGPGIYVAPAGETPRFVRGAVADRLFSHASKTMWLGPGERWLFYEEVGSNLRVLEGEMGTQAVMSSDGRCGDEQAYGRQSLPLQPIFLEAVESGPIRANVYRCWEGEVRSNVWNVTVKRPTSDVDREAFDYLQHQNGLIHDQETGEWRLSAFTYRVIREYPTSHYAYAALARAVSKAHQKMRAIDLQPENPLNPWVRAAVARHVLEYESSCRKSQAPSYDFSVPDLQVPSVSDLDVPEELSEYLDQYAWYLEHRHCPRVRAAEAEKGGERG